MKTRPIYDDSFRLLSLPYRDILDSLHRGGTTPALLNVHMLLLYSKGPPTAIGGPLSLDAAGA